MASKSIFKGSHGINNVLEPHRLQYDDAGYCHFAEAVNVVIDDSGGFYRRFGTNFLHDKGAHSLWSSGKYCFFVSEGDLYRVLSDFSVVKVIGGIGDTEMVYAVMHGKCYMSNSNVRLIVTDDSVSSWDAVVPEQFAGDSNVYGIIDNITSLAVHAGRLFAVSGGKYLWQSIPGNPCCFSISDGPINIPGLNGIVSVGTGLYVSCDDGVLFLSGSSKADFVRSVVYTKKIIKGTLNVIDGSDVRTGIEYPRLNAIWVSENGVCIGDIS